MYKHHEESIKNMAAHFSENPEIIALFLVGSVATGTAREDSDIDGVAVVSREEIARKKKNEGTLEVVFGKCTYDGGYFDIHYHSREEMEEIAQNGSEPMRNLFLCAQTLFCNEEGLPELVAKIPEYPKKVAEEKRLKFYCTLKQFYGYFWCACKPEGEILFPSMRKLEDAVISAPNKPENIIEKVKKFMQTLSDEDCYALVQSYEEWTSYDFPKDFQFINNHFADPYEWQ
jgi:predicted nucleotidyltransferase